MMKTKKNSSIKYKFIIIFIVLVFVLINSFSIHVFSLPNNIATITQQNTSESINRNESIMLPGKNMTFGVSLDNAKMHLMEAIMDLKENNIDGALMQLNITGDNINTHEQEMSDMMKMMDTMGKTEK
jgi:vancomycin permeability regulator SanA